MKIVKFLLVLALVISLVSIFTSINQQYKIDQLENNLKTLLDANFKLHEASLAKNCEINFRMDVIDESVSATEAMKKQDDCMLTVNVISKLYVSASTDTEPDLTEKEWKIVRELANPP